MAETKSKDQQAFPDEFNEGMTLRDYFAAKAMQELVSFYHDKWIIHKKELLAKEAYDLADAMLEARSK